MITIKQEIIEALKDAEECIESGEENFFLVMRVTSAIYDEKPKYQLNDLYTALRISKTWSVMDPMELLPLLIPANKPGASELIQLIVRQCSAKESLIAIQSSLESIHEETLEASSASLSTQLIRILRACCDFIPRLQLGKKGVEDTLQPVITQLDKVVDDVPPLIPKDDGRTIFLSVCELIDVVLHWSTQNTSIGDPQNERLSSHLSHLLCTAIGSCASFINASLAQRRFTIYYPRLVFDSKAPPKSEENNELIQLALKTAHSLSLTPHKLTSEPSSLGRMVLMAYHEPASITNGSEALPKFTPILVSSLRQNMAIDESLTLLLTLLHTSSNQLEQEIVDPLATILVPLASTHSQPPTRHIAFRLLSTLLTRAPPPVHLAHLSSLLSDSPFPQMRVAAVGLVKEAFLRHINCSHKEASPFSSSTLLRALGSKLFRPSPPDLFDSPTAKSLKQFLDSSEPARLTECLAFYYVLIMRDEKNATGVRDRDMIRTVQSGLLTPLKQALAVWTDDTSHLEDSHALMPIASLEVSLERVETAIMSIQRAS